ncbi:MDR family MFS transporter [Paenibacillus agri]|uniref:MFS transporter n=1 Tax=Paenibacillus agri TaxID=2744309 RepID=A0A850ERK6_9BACL|nr:MFS transporter [Paenibacillus agri]NUU63555.1 MFS transporter [Paenibacillus agri]
MSAKKINLLSFFRSYDGAVWLQFTGTILSSLTMFMIRPFLVLYLHDQMNGSVLLPILIVGLQPLFGIFAGIGGGSLSDRYGRKPVMVASLLLQTLSFAGYALADGIILFAAASILNGIGSALFQPAASAQISDIVLPEQRAEVYALLHMALNFGAAFGPALGLMLFSWNVHIVFWIAALLLAAYSGLLWLRLKESAPSRLPRSGQTNGAAVPWLTAAKQPENRMIIWLTLCYLPVGFLYAQVDSTLPFQLQTYFDNYKAVLATMLTFNGVTVILLQLWVAKVTSRFTARRMLSIAYLLFAAVALGYGFAPTLVLLLTAEFIFSVGEMLHGPHAQKAVAEMATADQRGYAFAIYGMGPQVSRALGPLLGGIVLDLWNGTALFVLIAFFTLIMGRIQSRLLRNAASGKHHSTSTPVNPPVA